MQSIKINIESNFKESTVMIDKVRTQQILINLIQNSIKFSKEDSVITVRVERFQHQVEACMKGEI